MLTLASRLLGLALAVATAGCTFTVAKEGPPPSEPLRTSFQPDVQHTVGEYVFGLGGGEPTTFRYDGRILGTEIMRAWRRRGYVREHRFVEGGAFTDNADYRVTLSGSHRGETSFWMQAVNFLTLGLVPYSITNRYDLTCTLADPYGAHTWTATAQATDKTWVDILLLPALPFADNGHALTVERMADHLYEELRRQGAFQAPDVRPAAAPQTG